LLSPEQYEMFLARVVEKLGSDGMERMIGLLKSIKFVFAV